MLKDIETNKVDMVVVKSYSKLTRNSFQLINFIENILKPRNIKLISLREGNFYYEIPKSFIDELKTRMIV